MPAFTTGLGASILGMLGASSMSTTLATATGVAATAGLAAGGVAGAGALMKKEKKTEPLAMPTAPTPTDAKETARLEGEKLRRIRAMSGGKTILTSEGMGTGSGLKTLLGS